MLVSLALSTLAMGVSLPVIPLFAASFTEATALVGLIVAMRWIARLVLNIPVGIWCERWGPGRVFLWGSGAVVLSGVGSALAPGWELLLVARVVEGAGAAMTITAGMTVAAQQSEQSRRGRAFGHLQTAQRAGYWLGPPLGGTVAAAAGYRPSLWLYTLLSLVALAVVGTARPQAVRVRPARSSFGREALVVLTRPQFLLIGLVTFVVFFTMTGAQFTAVPVFIERVLGMGPDVVGWSLFAANAIGFALIYPSGIASDRISRRLVIVVLLGLTALGLFLVPRVDSVAGILAASLVLGAGNTLRGPATNAYLVEAVGDAPMGVALGLFRSAGDVGSALGPITAGWALTFGHAQFFVLNGLLALAVMVAFAIAGHARPAAATA